MKWNIFILNAINRFFCNIFIKCYMYMVLKVDISNIFLGVLSFCVIKAQFCCSEMSKRILMCKFGSGFMIFLELIGIPKFCLMLLEQLVFL